MKSFVIVVTESIESIPKSQECQEHTFQKKQFKELRPNPFLSNPSSKKTKKIVGIFQTLLS